MEMRGMMSSAAFFSPPMPEVEEGVSFWGWGKGSLQQHHSGRMMVNNPLNKALVALGGFPPQILISIGWTDGLKEHVFWAYICVKVVPSSWWIFESTKFCFQHFKMLGAPPKKKLSLSLRAGKMFICCSSLKVFSTSDRAPLLVG